MRVGRLSHGRTVLDVFACTGGFSVYAAAGGATEVLSVDQSEPALEAARRNMDHNRSSVLVRTCRHHVIAGDAFTVMADLAGRGRRFDVVVVDPPSFAARQSKVPAALRTPTAASPGSPWRSSSRVARSSGVVLEPGHGGGLHDRGRTGPRVAGRSLDVSTAPGTRSTTRSRSPRAPT